MAGLDEYLNEYGNKHFEEMPFCEADNVALCQIVYNLLENVVSPSFDEEPVSFSQVADCLYSYNGCKHRGAGLMIGKGISVRLMAMAKSERYRDVKLVAMQSEFDAKEAIQFAACTFLLTDGTVAVIYRGTDDTLIGWKEDFDLYIKKGIPSHALAVNYLNEAAAHFDGKLIVCGHSKGGNLALYAALKCKQEVRDRIEALYNNDGPGFIDASLFRTEQYKQLLPRYKHFLPNASFVGVLLMHDYDFTAVKSKRILGPLQHDLGTWKIEDTKLVAADGLNKLGQIADLGLCELIASFTHEQGNNIGEVMVKIIEGTGQKGLLGVAQNLVSSVSGGKKAWKELSQAQKDDFKKFLFDIPRYLVTATIDITRGAATAAEKRAAEFVDAVASN